MPDIMICCPLFGTSVPTGLSTEMIVFASLPNVATPLRCPACRKMHRWKPKDAWVEGEAKPKGAARKLKTEKGPRQAPGEGGSDGL